MRTTIALAAALTLQIVPFALHAADPSNADVAVASGPARIKARELSATAWHPVEGNLMTRWARQVDPARPLPEYPRPQMVRAQWQNLNGLWQFAITNKDSPPAAYD